MDKRLCYGTYAKVLYLCGLNKPTQETIHTGLMRPVDDLSLLNEVSAQASRLFNCNINQDTSLVDEVRLAAPSVVRENIAEFTKEHINPNKLESAAAAVWAVIMSDGNISDDSIVDCISGLSKGSLNQARAINAVDFLTGTFIFAVVNAYNKEGRACIKDINSEFITQAAEQFKENGFTVIKEHAAHNPLSSPLKEHPKRNIDGAAESILSVSKLKFEEYVKLKAVNIDYNLLPQIISDNPGSGGKYSYLANIAVEGSPAESVTLLCGEGGSGKTYLMFDCYRTLLEEDGVIPFYVPMAQLARADKSPVLHYVFDHYFAKSGWEREINLFKQNIAALLEDGGLTLVFLLDAYNEYAYTAQESSIHAVEDEILWLRGFSNVRIIITSRSGKGFDNACIYRTEKLDMKCVAEYLEAYKPTANIDIWDAANEKVMELLRLPIMLTMFAMTYSPGKSGEKEAEINRIKKHSDILEMCVNKQLGTLRNHQTAPYVLKVLLPLLSNEMDRLRIRRMKRREAGEHAYSAVQYTMSDEYSDMWWDYDFDRRNIEAVCADAADTYKHLIDGALLKNGLFLSEEEGMISWRHELLLNWFTAKCIVLRLAYERESALKKIKDVAVSMEKSSDEAEALLPVALYLYEMLEDDGSVNSAEEFIVLLMSLAHTYKDWRDSPNIYKFARLALEKLDSADLDIPGWRIAYMKCRTAYTLLSVYGSKMEAGFSYEECIDGAKRHFEEALELSRLDISSGDELEAKITESMAYGNLGAYYLAKNKIHPDKSHIKEALKYHREGLAVREAAFKNDMDSPEAAAYIGASYHCIAADYDEMGEYDDSLANYYKAIEFRENGGAKEIRLAESCVRAIGVLLKLIKTGGTGSHNRLGEAHSLFYMALQHTKCLNRNRYELSKLADYCKTLYDIIDALGTEADESIRAQAEDIAVQIKSLSE